jgi:predicted ATP-grasp superfamily ATP-dependent carboligase
MAVSVARVSIGVKRELLIGGFPGYSAIGRVARKIYVPLLFNKNKLDT